MAQKINIDNQEYDLTDLSDRGKANLLSLQFTNERLQELNNMQALLQRAKNSYISSLKKEIISQKAGYIIDE